MYKLLYIPKWRHLRKNPYFSLLKYLIWKSHISTYGRLSLVHILSLLGTWLIQVSISCIVEDSQIWQTLCGKTII
jgi:hypothetical protein